MLGAHDDAGCCLKSGEGWWGGGGGVVTYETMFLNDYVQLCHINEFYCVFITNAKTTQAPDSNFALFTPEMESVGGGG